LDRTLRFLIGLVYKVTFSHIKSCLAIYSRDNICGMHITISINGLKGKRGVTMKKYAKLQVLGRPSSPII